MVIVYFQMNQIVIDPTLYTPAAKWQMMTGIYSSCQQEGGCIVWGKALNTCGYPSKKMRLPNYPEPKNLLVSRLLFSISSGMILGGSHSQGMHVSHLCHNKKCLNLAHLTLEPGKVNNLRRACVLGGVCS